MTPKLNSMLSINPHYKQPSGLQTQHCDWNDVYSLDIKAMTDIGMAQDLMFDF
jgi:hypothetical protein